MVPIRRVAVPTGTEAIIHSDTALPDFRESKETSSMHHCTRLEFLDEILKDGLVPLRPLNKIIDGQLTLIMPIVKAVFISEEPFEWMHWAQCLPDGEYAPGALITLDVDGLEKIQDPVGCNDGDWAVLERISPDRFLRIATSTMEDPSSFKPYKIESTRGPNHGP